MKLAVLYAGQGAQHPGMGREFYEDFPAFRAAFDSAALEFDLHRVCFEDPDGILNQTEYTQPCMVAFACGVSAVLAEKAYSPPMLPGSLSANTPRWKPPGCSPRNRPSSWPLIVAKPWPTRPRASTAG